LSKALTDSRIAHFYRKSIAERIDELADRELIEPADARALSDKTQLLEPELADKMIENVIGVFGLPLATATNFLVNGRDYIVPMVVEEASVVAGVSSAAKAARSSGGFRVTSTDPVLIGQIQLVDIENPDPAVQALFTASDELIDLANSLQPNLLARGGGTRELEFFKYKLPSGKWSVVMHVLVDTRDAMGANLVNTICEGMAPRVEEISNGRAILKILSNLADKSLVTARVIMPLSELAQDGYAAEDVRDAIVLANEFANTDPYRAATHNKGIMNGVDAVAIATGNDWRAVEAGAHAYAARSGAYRALTNWTVGNKGDLLGELVMPIKVGVVGGSLKSNPAASLGLKIAGAKTAPELAELMGAVGLAQNFAALRALVTDGIQKGHMSLHARSIASSAGTPDDLFDQVVDGMIESGDVKRWKAHELIDELQGDSASTETDASPDDAARGTAAGKVILLGEHAVVYDRHALALPLEAAISATIVETSADIKISIPDWDFEQSFMIMRALGVHDRSFYVRVRSRIPAAMGLGASAALAVAIIRAFDQLLNLNMDDAAVDRMAFECEKLAHGKPSGIDNNIATYGEPVLYSKSSATRTKPIALTEAPPIVVASSGIRGITKDQVAGVRSRYEKNTQVYETIFNEIDEISLAGAHALKTRDYDTLGALMNVCHGYLNALQVSTPELEQMIQIARSHGASGAKLTGAGGGGSIVALCPDKESEVARALHEAGYQIVRMRDR
jgi:hydroxymethylglutaryl-CoA reductase